ncbi:MAG: hypothetical protein UU93_C0006G0052 [Candidatus Amesbacteria bacterium GW2011_GWA2_42_12]|uniref:GIY-YIG domain-containing protein n=1 Tax=Candidatus Amesbacteria bacterium GW2011_GWA2_42_12 TaxID=1618356 RepID=A0A0G1B4V7_9BACT|nr:MAG: hypothetical protein UU93_C0006G0052 [Candidatus Amesbacteria bacterium GW2011_GWA2_42_12]
MPSWRNPACRQAGGRHKIMYFLYILKSLSRNIYYKGITNNIDRRLVEHLSGQSRSTKSLLPINLIHVEVCETRIKARELEKYFKSGAGREIIKEIDSM